MTQNDTSTPCEVCNGTGLAILPVRYTVVPASCPGAGLGPFPKGRGSKEDVSAAGYDYAVRTLRQGMLYLFYEQSGPYGSRQWEAYAVAENGTLWRQVSGYAARRIAGGGVPSCSRPVHNAERMEFITLRYPHLCGTVWVMFSEHLLTPATLKRYAADATLRAERMQPITPKQWIGAPQAKGDTVPLSSADALKAVLEYRGVAGEVSEPAQLPYLRKPRAISGKDGSYTADVLRANATRYPWSLRTHAAGGASGEAALQQRYARICAASHNGKQGDQRQTYMPMLLGLWDAVGVVHELNGYRHDVVAAMARYKDERALEFNAMEHIEQIDTLLQRNAAVLSDQYAQASRARMEELEQEQAGGNALTQSGMDALRTHGIASSNAGTWDGLSKALLPVYQRQARETWEQTYRPRIDATAYAAFKANAQRFGQAAMELLTQRTQVLGAWLSNPLFLVTLEDYDGTSPSCGVRFEEVITHAIGAGHGPGRSPAPAGPGGQSDVTSRSCLLWRVVAQNQDEAREELKQTLSEADQQKNMVLSAAGAGWSVFVTTSKTLKKFLSVYKGFETAQKQAAPLTATDRILRETGVDRFVTTAGAFLLNRFPLNGVQDKVGNALVRFVLMTRALLDEAEVSELISQEASTGVAVRSYFMERVEHYRSQTLTSGTPMMYALRDVERHKGTDLMRERWEQASQSSRNAVRLASLTGVLELVNFINLLSKSDKQARDYGSLVASGAALVSVYSSMAEKVSKEFFGDASRSMSRMKAIGGWLGGFGTYIGAYYDFGDAVTYWKKEDYQAAVLYGMKTTAGVAVGGAQFLTALVYSAPIIEKALGRRGIVIWLDALKAGLQAATAKEGEDLLAKASMKRLGMAILRVGGWEVTVALIAIDILIYAIKPDALEKWCESNQFGKVEKGKLFGIGASAPRYKTLKEQDEMFQKAIGEVTVRPA
ncbi:T6SS effector BTH_I2691 family protein [Xanthomonas oryzae]|uniref:T6SS effector BTH_I2691 family protein n=1 Tax=Xanthomonas oryzae TaxID=347 RepID=UPI0030DB238F